MPRFRRQIEAGTVQHVISRLLNGEYLLDHVGARGYLMDSVQRALGRTDWRLLAYALMSNHAHWVLVAGRYPLRAWVQPAHVRFARWLRTHHGGLGPVFADRPRNVTIEGPSAAAVVAYVHNNPVRAGVAGSAGECTWSSHRAYVGACPAPLWLDVETGYELCGFAASASRRRVFDDFVRARSEEPRNDAWVGLDQERRRVEARARHQLPTELGSSTLSAQKGLRTDAAPFVPRRSPQRLRFTAGPGQVVTAVAEYTGVAEARLVGHDRAYHVSRAKRLAVHCWVHGLGGSVTAIAAQLGVPKTTASSMLRIQVDELDSHAVCARLERLEGPSRL